VRNTFVSALHPCDGSLVIIKNTKIGVLLAIFIRCSSVSSTNRQPRLHVLDVAPTLEVQQDATGRVQSGGPQRGVGRNHGNRDGGKRRKLLRGAEEQLHRYEE
jgi:hypothetical protein